jgi:hypothetical protein
MGSMKAIEIVGDVDRQRHLSAEVPESLPPGPVRVLVLPPETRAADPAADNWMRAVATEWAEELADPRQDWYTLEDGQPLDGSR